MGSLREEVLSTPVTVGSHQIYWGSPKPYLLIWCFDHLSSGRVMFESRTWWGFMTSTQQRPGVLDVRAVCLWHVTVHDPFEPDYEGWKRMLDHVKVLEREKSVWAGNWGASTFDPRFQRWAKNWQIDRNGVSNAIRRLPMGRSSDEFKAEILMPGT